MEELLVGGGEVFVLAFVLPAEMVAEPDIGPAATGGCGDGGFVVDFSFADTALERVPSAFGVGGGRLGLAKEVAEIEEVLLAGAAFGELNGLPLLDEFVWSQSRGAAASWWLEYLM